MRHKTFFRRANLMLLAIGLALAASGLLAWALAASAGPSMAAQTDPSSGLSAAASISGLTP